MRYGELKFEPIWDIEKIEEFFKGRELPGQVWIDKCTKVTDISKFLKKHIKIIRENNGNLRYKGYYVRLVKLKKVLGGERRIERKNELGGIFNNVAK